VAERFNYDYSETEIEEIVDRIEKIDPEVERLDIVANNNRSSYAPKAALCIELLLEERGRLKKKLGELALKNRR
jgi:uncharacterized protein YecE (DUF72 family)